MRGPPEAQAPREVSPEVGAVGEVEAPPTVQAAVEPTPVARKKGRKSAPEPAPAAAVSEPAPALAPEGEPAEEPAPAPESTTVAEPEALVEPAPPEALPPPPPLEPLPAMAPLPDTFGEDRLVVMARDPESAFLYWELTPNGVGRARDTLGAAAARAQLTLRIYRGEGPESTHEDHPVQDWVGRYTLQLERSGLRVAASIGFLADQVFVHVTQSAAVRLPRRAPGDAPVRFIRRGPEPRSAPQPASTPSSLGVRHGSAPASNPAATETGGSTGPGATPAAAGPAGSHHLFPQGRGGNRP